MGKLYNPYNLTTVTLELALSVVHSGNGNSKRGWVNS